MDRFHFELNFAFFIVILVDGATAGATQSIQRTHGAVTFPAELEAFYVRIKRETPRTYADEGNSGQLRQEDYTGIIRYEHYRGVGRSLSYTQRVPADSDEESDLEDKSLICEGIFGSGFFEMRDEEAVDFGPNETRIRKDLLNRHPDIYDDIFGNWPNKRGEWLNPYRPLDVCLSIVEDDEVVQENVFMCVTRKRESFASYSYVGYFISAIYRSWSVENIMNGRFVFTSTENGKLKLFAIAEEPALVDETVIENTHSFYFAARNRAHREPDASKNPVCTLTVSDKVRLCATVLSSAAFKGKIKFYPGEEYVEAECVKRKVSYRGWVQIAPNTGRWYSSCCLTAHRFVSKYVEMTYNEWMIGCKVVPDTDRNRRATLTYYISRGYTSRTSIVFESAERDTYIPQTGVTWVRLIPGNGEVRPLTVTRIQENLAS